MENNLINKDAASVGIELGHRIAASTRIFGIRAATYGMVEAMSAILKKESAEDGPDICIATMLAFIGDLYGAGGNPPISMKAQIPYILEVIAQSADILGNKE